MSVQAQIDSYIGEQPAAKGEDLRALHQLVLRLAPGCKLWFLDGRNEDGKIVTNPNIGHGSQTTTYANGETREFYRVGLSANTAGLSIYIMGLDDKTWLARTYGERLGKAKVTGYCVKVRALKDVDMGVVEEMIAQHMS